MKKLMMAAAIVCAAVGVQAAQIDWSFGIDTGYMGEYAVSDSATYYFIAGSSSVGSTLAGILTAENTDGATNFKNALSAYVSQNGALSEGAVSATLYGLAEAGTAAEPGANDYAAIFVFSDGVVGGEDFAYTVYDIKDYLYTPPASGTSAEFYDADWGDSQYAASWGNGTIATEKEEPIPEPTSAMLMLLGVAGLALKRKRA